jgi:hypothetical protein
MARKRVLRMNDFMERIGSIIDDTVHFQSTHASMIEQIAEDVWNHPDFKRLTRYEVGYVRGFSDYRMRSIYSLLYFAYEIDGKVMTFDEWRTMNPGGNPAEVFTNNNGNHYWKETTKPY